MEEKNVIAETERLILRRYVESDLEDLYEYLSNPNVVKYEPYKPMNMDETRQNLDWRISTDEMIAVELKSSHKMIGNVYLGKRDFESLEIGYVFNQDYWGKGYAKESCLALAEQAFSHGVHRIFAECDPENLSSWKLLESLGFEREAHLKQNVYFWKDKENRPLWKDTYIYAKLRKHISDVDIRKFTESQKNEVIQKFGSEFLQKILNDIKIYSQKWQLSDFEFATLSSHNVIFFCKSDLYGCCVLKLYGLLWEYNTLCEYESSGKFCRVYEFDRKTQAMLMERIVPGKTLKEERSLEKRLACFSKLFAGLHIEPKNPNLYASYFKMVCDVTENMKTREDTKELYPYALKMKEIFMEMLTAYDKSALLHWDLNNENILLCEDGMYKLIDPMGLIGDPVLEIGRYLSKEYSDAAAENRLEIVCKISDYFEENLNIPRKISIQCFYIDIVFLNCHFVDQGRTACMDDIKFAEKILIDVRQRITT